MGCGHCRWHINLLNLSASPGNLHFKHVFRVVLTQKPPKTLKPRKSCHFLGVVDCCYLNRVPATSVCGGSEGCRERCPAPRLFTSLHPRSNKSHRALTPHNRAPNPRNAFASQEFTAQVSTCPKTQPCCPQARPVRPSQGETPWGAEGTARSASHTAVGSSRLWTARFHSSPTPPTHHSPAPSLQSPPLSTHGELHPRHARPPRILQRSRVTLRLSTHPVLMDTGGVSSFRGLGRGQGRLRVRNKGLWSGGDRSWAGLRSWPWFGIQTGFEA